MTLVACTTVGPDFDEPEIAWLSDWQSDLYDPLGNREKQSDLDLRFWWKLFDDPVLDGLIEDAWTQNPTLRIAGLRILESRALSGIAKSNLYPQGQQISGGAAYINSQQTGDKNGAGNQSFASYDVGFGLGWELDFWGKFQRGIESADAGFFASVTSYQDVMVLLSAQVVDFYFTYRTTQLRIALAQKNAEIQHRSFEITERLYRGGQNSELDLQQAKTQYLATLGTIPALGILLGKTRNALGALLGRAPGNLPELDTTEYDLPRVSPLSIDGTPVNLLTRRPDVRSAAWLAAAQSAQIGVAEADFYPAITLLGSISWSGSSLAASPNVGTFAVGPTFTWNIFDYGRIANNVLVQDARLQQAIEAFQNTVLQAAREIDDAAISVAKTHEQQNLNRQTVQAAERSLELADTLYIEGYVGFQRVLDAQRALFVQSDGEISNQGNHIAAVIDLYKAFGGGWHQTQTQDLIPLEIQNAMENRSNWGDMLKSPLPPVPVSAATDSESLK
ncbi:MAG: TolC family protein [Alphaproteobacteria bacterium]|nr:MAG: TolC family protein [Alphaproteobacteria bacterium]